ncbi:MAG: NADH:flavin oxidoreductase [Candidatus Abyssobacteria bacterium SURF_17]|uniref:NADH:flavin oxidoreductase n=1 Tax=Candidatus Abyssobacteria bacterium SURF_17 TaxID=2093361 RepID=A0A419ESL9_9BACT|nr:MAG: NADH:flavin oxidoreductase [Candidatus Abyssubacteria bacterium SURF_17]
MSLLFEPFQIKSINIRNRTVRSATYEGMGTHAGAPSKQLAKLYNTLAEGQVGLLVTSATLIERFKISLPEDENLAYPTFIDSDAMIALWRPIVKDVHARGAAIAMQVVHPGRQENPMLRGGEPPIAPSAVEEKAFGNMPRAMSVGEIEEMVEKFAQVCRRVKEAGLDAVQLHGGHGYLLSNFISPYTNRRTDEYGGDTRRRAKIIVDIVRRARELVGEDYPIMIKMNCSDFVPDGLTKDEAARVAAVIADAGIDCIEITGGIYETREEMSRKGINKQEKETYFRPYAEALRNTVKVPLILVGGVRTPKVAERVLSDGIADMISFSRPFIREPQLIKRWKEGDLRKATCISCNQCSDNVFTQPMRCYVEEAKRAKREKNL